MNSANVLAWLTCLILAFFACILAVRNAGKHVSTDKEIQKIIQKTNAMESTDYRERTQRIQKNIENIRSELETLEKAADDTTNAKVKEKIGILQELLENLEESFQPAPSEKESSGDL